LGIDVRQLPRKGARHRARQSSPLERAQIQPCLPRPFVAPAAAVDSDQHGAVKSGETAGDPLEEYVMARTTGRKATAATRSKTGAKAAVKSSAGSVRKPALASAEVPAKKAARTAGKARKSAAPVRKVPRPAVGLKHAASELRWVDTLRDGTHVIIRPIRKEDAELERSFIKRLSPESRRMRFLGQMREPSDDMLRRLTDIDYKNEMAFLALVHRDGQTQEIGVARYSTSGDRKFCECAITVSDEWHHKGLATLLMHHLIDVARTRGIRTMVSYDAIDNGQMRELATFLGFKRNSDPADSGMVVHTLTL
jgi:GNAT superfamily N-acetyltransferase